MSHPLPQTQHPREFRLHVKGPRSGGGAGWPLVQMSASEMGTALGGDRCLPGGWAEIQVGGMRVQLHQNTVMGQSLPWPLSEPCLEPGASGSTFSFCICCLLDPECSSPRSLLGSFFLTLS
jgi:hypothetical protein